MPAAAQCTLPGQLAQAGAWRHYHGDFDWPDIQIANHVLRTWAARHWRLAREDYEAAVAVAAVPQSRHDRAIAEEAVAAMLLEDLRKR